MDLTDVFGAPQERPSHPDFWKLSDVLLKMDGTIDPTTMSQEECEAAYVARLAELNIDPDVMGYAACQRALRGLAFFKDAPVEIRRMFATVLASAWIDGFAAGALYERGDQ